MSGAEQATSAGEPRGEVRQARRTAWLALTWIYAAGLAGWTIAAGRPAGGQVGDLLRLPVFAGPALAAFAGAELRSGRDRLGWRGVGLAWLLSAAAGLAWVAGAVRGGSGPLDRLADLVLYNAYYPFMIAGLCLLARFPHGAGARLRLAVDALIVVSATQALAWYFLLRHFAPGEVPPAWSSILTNQVGETLVLFCAALALHRPSRDGAEPALRLLALGAFVATVADLTSAGADLAPSAFQAVAGEVALVVSAALIATAGLLSPAPPRRRGLASELALRVLAHLPHAAIFAVAALLVGELPRVGPPGTPVPVLAIALTLLSALAILRLAASQREAEAEAAARAAQEERLHQGQKLAAVGELAAAVSHDFANLLTGLKGCTSELGERVPGAPELLEMQRLVQRGGELCGGLLRFARRAPPQEAADLCEVVAEVAPLLRRLLPAGIRLDLEGSPGVARALADPAQLEVALVNLVVNARDAMPRGGPIEVRVDAPELPEPGKGRGAPERFRRWARLAVRDQGGGMDEATLARCLEPFFTTKPAGRGTGLGLATVKGIVSAAGGRLVIDSSPGLGTRVSMLLPLAAGPGARPVPTPAPVPASPAPLAEAPGAPSGRLPAEAVSPAPGDGRR